MVPRCWLTQPSVVGEVAAENALKGNHHVAKLNLTPAAIYTLPEVAAVGLTEEQAREEIMAAVETDMAKDMAIYNKK